MELVTVLLLSEVRSRGSEPPSEVTRSEHGWRIEDEPTIRTYDKVTSGPLQAHYPMGTGHGPKGSRSPRECTNGAAHSPRNRPLRSQLEPSCLSVPPARTTSWRELHEASFPDCFSGTSLFSLSVGIRNHWLEVIPRGLFDPMSHYLYLPGHP
jgi:hypothetical protein